MLCSAKLYANDCEPVTPLIASYHKTTHAYNKPKQLSKFSLIRNKNKVLHVYPQLGVTHQWYQRIDDNVLLTRLFHKQKRGIEYQPNEINNQQKWQDKGQLVLTDFVKKMHLDSTTGNGCEQEQRFSYQHLGVSYQLTWLPQLALVKYFSIKNIGKSQTWTLVRQELNSHKIELAFEQYHDYDMIDYTDIGDNENDPFLQKMVNQGFREGIYQNGHLYHTH